MAEPAPPVLWIGGPPGSGKTTVARLLALRHGLRRYHADDRTWHHRDRAIAAGQPDAIRWEAMSPDRRWSGPPADLLAMSLHHARGPMVVDDVRALPPSPLVVAEGTTVTPAVPGAAVWLLPPDDVRRERLDERNLPPGPAALYHVLAHEIERAVREAGGAVLTDAGPVDDVVAAVETHFAAALDAGPTARTMADRSGLARDANRAVIDRYRAYLARPWTSGDLRTTIVDLDCECGHAGCRARVRSTVAAARGRAVLAHRLK